MSKQLIKVYTDHKQEVKKKSKSFKVNGRPSESAYVESLIKRDNQ